MPDDKTNHSDELTRQLMNGLESVSELSASLLTEVKASAVLMNAAQTDLRRVLHLMDGNGQPALAVRLTRIEEHQKTLFNTLKRLETSGAVSAAGRWKLLAALITGGVALVGTAITALVTLLSR